MFYVFLLVYLLLSLHPLQLLFLDGANLTEFLAERELFFLHHLADTLLANIFYLGQQICAEYSHILVHGHAYLPAKEQNDQRWGQSW